MKPLKQTLSKTNGAFEGLRWNILLICAIDILMLFLVGFILTSYSVPLKSWLTHGGNLIISNEATQDQGLLSYFFGIPGMIKTVSVLSFIILCEGISILLVVIYLQGKLLSTIKNPPESWWTRFPNLTIKWGILWGAVSILSRIGNAANTLSERIQPGATVFDWQAVFVPLRIAIVWLWMWQSTSHLLGKSMTMRETIATLWKKPLSHLKAILLVAVLFGAIQLVLKYVHSTFTWFSPLVGNYPLIWILFALILVFPSLIYARLFILEVNHDE